MRKWWLNLVLLAAAIGLGLYVYQRPVQEEVQGFPISSLSPALVTRFSVERADQKMELEKKGEVWSLVRPYAARADTSLVTRLLEVFAVKSREKLAATELARFDLDKPALVLRAGDQAVGFGTTNSLTKDQYVLSAGNVYLIPSFYGMQIPERADRLLTHSLFADGEKPVAIDVGTLSAEQKDGKWTVSRPQSASQPPATALSQDDLNRWSDDWRLSSSLLTQPYDLRPGIGKVKVKLSNGKTLTLEVLQKEPDLILARTDEMLQFQYSTEAGKRLMDPQPEPLPEMPKSAVTPGTK